MLDTGATYHVCPNRDWFFIFEKLDGCFVFMGDDRSCNMEGIGYSPDQDVRWDGIGIEISEIFTST